MARAQAYHGVDMGLVDIWYGDVETYDSTTIRIESGDWTGTYRGSFAYGYYGDVYGTLDSYTESYRGSTWFAVTEIGRNANTYQSYLDYGDAEGALAYVLSGRDDLDGSSQNDTLLGLGGDDTISGHGGRDRLHGGEGDDRVFGGTGWDVILGEDGDDRLFGNAGDDRLNGQSGDDRLFGGTGHDRLYGSVGDDRLTGGSGDDRMFGGLGEDRLFGGSGQDQLTGLTGRDRLNGGAGDDVLTGGGQADIFVFRGAFGADTITDFSLGLRGEKINLSGVRSIGSFDDLVSNHLEQRGEDAVIADRAGNSVTLLGVDIEGLEANDFVF